MFWMPYSSCKSPAKAIEVPAFCATCCFPDVFRKEPDFVFRERSHQRYKILYPESAPSQAYSVRP
jgi:hypothetical protein